MQTQRIQIKDLQAGMKIKSFNSDTKKIAFLEVTDKWNTIVPHHDQRHLKFSNGAEIHCSKNHPIMVLDDDLNVAQVYPDDLTGDSMIISDNGSLVFMESINEDRQDENYIDITVSETHTFFASNNKNDDMILTHNSQGGVRGGAATIYYPIWHYEAQDLLVLKNNKGTEDNRVRHMDYGVQFNKLMYERLITGGDITLFSPSDVPGLHDSFYADQDKFRELYVKAERNTRIRKKTVKAAELFSSFMEERKNTGRIYLQNVDNANEHGSFLPIFAPIKQSNLCLTGDTLVNIFINGVNKRRTLDDVISNFSFGGDIKIKSKNLDTGIIEYKQITNAAMTARNAELILIEDNESGKSIKCTPDHKVYTKNRGYIMAKDLKEDDTLDIA